MSTIKITLIAFTIMAFALPAFADTALEMSGTPRVAIGSFDTVAYFTAGKAITGSLECQTNWHGAHWAEPTDSAPAVDLKLVLAADVSGSIDKDELQLQREGYVNALRNVEVINAALSGMRRRIAIAYFEWAGANDQRLIMPWTVIDDPDSAWSFAKALEKQPIGIAGGGTSISGALSFSSRLLRP